MTWLEAKNGGTLVRLRIQPKASRTEIVGLHGVPPRLKIRIAAPPVDGAANEEVLRFLKKLLGAPTLLVRGEKSKDKDVLCVGLTHEAVERILLPGSAPTSN